jgi:hypothetical protein
MQSDDIWQHANIIFKLKRGSGKEKGYDYTQMMFGRDLHSAVWKLGHISEKLICTMQER